MSVRAVIAAGCVLCAACTLFVDAGGLSGDPAATAPEGGSGDATTTPDATALLDGASADVAVDGPRAADPCPPGAFCDDFERMDTQGPWDYIREGGGCTLSIDRSFSDRGSASLKNTLVAQTQESVCFGYVSRDFTSPASKIAISFAMRMSNVSSRNFHFVGINVETNDLHLFMDMAESGPYVAEQQFAGAGAGTDVYQAGSFSPNVTHRILFEHEIATRRTVLTIDGEVRLDKIMKRSFAAPGYNVGLGSNYNQAGEAREIWYDDFRVVPTP